MLIYNLYSNQPTFLCRAAVVLLLPSDLSSYCNISPTQLKCHISLLMNTQTQKHTQPLSLAQHVGAEPVLCPLRRERFDPRQAMNVQIVSDSAWVTERVS